MDKHWYLVETRGGFGGNLLEKEFHELFPENNMCYELSDTDVINLIIKFGRAEITCPENADHRKIEFQNDYD